MEILIVTVGGSCEPIVNAINSKRPDFVYFICSSGSKGSWITVEGKGNPCEEREKPPQPNIIVQTGLSPTQYKIWPLEDPDNLAHCYNRLRDLVSDLQAHFGDKNPHITANYTGGTKTMSVALSLMAINQENWDLELNKGPRVDLVKVKGGDVPILINKWEIFVEHGLTLVKQFISSFYYAQARETILSLVRRPITSSSENKLIKIAGLCQAFDAWDRFSHEQAFLLLEPYAGIYPQQFLCLKKILGKIKDVTGYEKIVDLIRNAERRAAQQRYDDAVARLYRALEMLAQIRLKTVYGYDTGNLSLADLPSHLQQKYQKFCRENNKIVLGLRQAFYLLAQLGDIVGKHFMQKENQILNHLKIRNVSILAHGEIPVTKEEYQKVADIFVPFIMDILNKLKLKLQIPQLPTDIVDKITSSGS